MRNSPKRSSNEEETKELRKDYTKAMKIIDIDKNGNLKFLEEVVHQMSEIKGNILIWGILGKTRLGKSTSMNILYELLTGTPGEPFLVKEGPYPMMKGIWVKLITWEMMSPEIRDKFELRGIKGVNVALWDCEGTEAGNSQALAKLYLITLLTSHVCSIHTSKILDNTFRQTLEKS